MGNISFILYIKAQNAFVFNYKVNVVFQIEACVDLYTFSHGYQKFSYSNSSFIDDVKLQLDDVNINVKRKKAFQLDIQVFTLIANVVRCETYLDSETHKEITIEDFRIV